MAEQADPHFPSDAVAALIDVSDTEWRHDDDDWLMEATAAALIDVSDTEWRQSIFTLYLFAWFAALIDVSDTEWRINSKQSPRCILCSTH